MAGSGDISRITWERALSSGVGSMITNAAISGPPGDLIGNLSASLTGASQTSIPCAASGGGAVLTKGIPAHSIVCVMAAAGTVDTQEYFLVTTAAAISATSMTISSQTCRVSHVAGDPIYHIAHPLWLTLNTTAPTSHALGTEYGATGMARQSLLLTATTVADPPVVANSSVITWGPMTAGTGGSVTNGAVMDALTGGTADNMTGFYTWGTAKTPGTGDSVQLAAGALTTAGS